MLLTEWKKKNSFSFSPPQIFPSFSFWNIYCKLTWVPHYAQEKEQEGKPDRGELDVREKETPLSEMTSIHIS